MTPSDFTYHLAVRRFAIFQSSSHRMVQIQAFHHPTPLYLLVWPADPHTKTQAQSATPKIAASPRTGSHCPLPTSESLTTLLLFTGMCISAKLAHTFDLNFLSHGALYYTCLIMPFFPLHQEILECSFLKYPLNKCLLSVRTIKGRHEDPKPSLAPGPQCSTHHTGV